MQAIIPMPLQIVIDDVGWWCGRDGSASHEPYRTGIARNHVPADYAAIARLGRELHMRPQAALVLGEWDISNTLRSLPSAQWMGRDWHCCWPSGPMDEAADILRREADHLELTLHGIGHEYWPGDGTMRRAELFDFTDDVVQPIDHVKEVLDAFARLMEQHHLGPLPMSYAPCAFAHSFDSRNTAALRDFGIRRISTAFRKLHNRQALPDAMFGVEQGIVTIERGDVSPPWQMIATDPALLPGYHVHGPIIGLHWPNILHDDPARNDEVVDHWVRFLRPIHHRPEFTLAPDSEFAWSQFIHHRTSRVTPVKDGWLLRFAPGDHVSDQLLVKIQGPRDLRWLGRGITFDHIQYDDRGDCHVLRCRRASRAIEATILAA